MEYLNLSNKEFIIFPFNILMISFIVLFFPLFYLFISREKHKIRKRKKKINKIELQSFAELPLKYDIYRKLTHLVVLGIIFFYFTFGYLNQNLVVFLVGISLIGLLTADIVRILTPEIYPLKPVNQLLREKELHMRLGPHISMSIGCFSIIMLYGMIQPLGPVIICTSMVMSIFGDIASNLIGRTIGSRQIRNTKKTYEGLLAGIIVAFFSGITIFFLLKDFYRISILGLFLIPFIGAMIIGILDYLDLEIDDNLSYNFCLSTVFFFIAGFIL
jgi:dolichol kinase